MSIIEKFSLQGKVGFVTGGAQGLGFEMVSALAEAGADVVVADINFPSAKAAAEAIEQKIGRRAVAVPVDVSRGESVNSAIEFCVEKLGRLDICIANAGIAENNLPVREIEDFAFDQWNKIIGVNLTGVFNTNMAAGKYMKQQGSGKIINIASIMGLAADPAYGTIAYTASKGGVVQLTRQLGYMLAKHNVQVNAIAPGFISTGMSDAEKPDHPDPFIQKLQQQVLARTPMGRSGVPEEVKGIALFLASEASSYCTGGIYAVDGGWLSA